MEKEELTAILEQVKATARETIKALKAEEQQTAESLTREKEAKDTLAQVRQLTEKISSLETKTVETDGRIKTVCETFPSLCEKVEALAKKLETPPPAIVPPAEPLKPKEGKKGILETGHENIEDLLSCPECLLGHIKKIGFDKAAEEICKDDEACKAAIAELTKKGYKIEEPKKVEEPKKEETSEGKDEEGKEGDGSFTLGQGKEEAPAD